MPGETNANPAEAVSRPAESTPCSLLIVEDTIIHSTIISRIAEQAGFKAAIAKSFEEAAVLLRQRPFDCITLDLGLGEHAGAEVFRLLAAAGCKSPIVIISGAEQTVCEATERVGISLGLNIRGAIRKPVDLKVLRETLAEIKHDLQHPRLATAIR